MRRMLTVAALLAVTIPAMGQAADPDAEKEVARLSVQITEALVKGDAKFLDGVMADDWIMISPDGNSEDKARNLKAVREGAVKYEAMEKSEMKVRVYGDAAVVTGRILARIRIKDQLVGGPVSFTEVFIRSGGKWRSVSIQVTHIAAPRVPSP